MFTFFRRRQSKIRRRPLRQFFTPRGEMLEDRRVLAEVEWSGGDNNDSNWTSNSNWAGLGGASAGDDLIFQGGASRRANNNDFPVNTSFNRIEFGGLDGNYVVSGNQIILVDGMSSNVGNGTAPIFHPNIILAANQGFVNPNFNPSPFTLDGVINLNTHTLGLNPQKSTGSIVLDGTINGTGTLNIFGLGTAFINGSAGGFGNTNLNLGTLQVGGTLGAVTIKDGTLRGTGTVGAVDANCVGCSGIIAPGSGGNTTGILTSNQGVSLSAPFTLAIDVNGTAPGTSYDRLTATGGNISLGGANLDLSLGFTPTVGQNFTILSTVGAGNSITGQFAQGTTVVVDGQVFSITYNSTSVVLTAQGTSRSWDGGGANNNWSTAANWNPDFVPVDGLDLIFW